MALALNAQRLPQRPMSSRNPFQQAHQQGATAPQMGPTQFQAPAQKRPMPAMGGVRPNQPTAPVNDPRAGIDSLYGQMLEENQKARGDVEQMGMRNINALLRRNASLAAMSGQGIGGGYLSGQRTALTTGMQGLQAGLMQNDAARRDILMKQLGDKLADTRRDEDWARQDSKDKAGAEAEKNKQMRQAEVDNWLGAFKNQIGDPNHPSNAWFNTWVQQYLITGDPAIKAQIEREIASRPKAPGPSSSQISQQAALSGARNRYT